MNVTALQRLRAKLAADEPVYGLWVTLDAASITEMAVAMGLDWVTIDAEHGHLDWNDIVNHLRGAVRSETVVLVRLAETNAALVKRALDIGADGIVVPWVETAAQLEQIVSSAHYPPAGVRGIGAERATGWGQCIAAHVKEAEDNVLVVPVIESVTAGRNVPAMLDVPGVEVFFFGPADYSATAGHAGEWEGARVADEIKAAAQAIRAAGKHCGVVAGDIDGVRERLAQGFRMLSLGLDGGLLIGALADRLTQLGRQSAIQPSLRAEG